MKRTYVNRLPKNEEVKNANVRVENGQLFVEVEFKEKFEPKDGDFYVNVTNNRCIFIYNANYKLRSNRLLGYYVGIDCYSDITINEDNKFGFSNEIRHATPEEKATFLERLEKECRKRWNPETKKLEDIRWRAEKGCDYFYIDSSVSIKPVKDNDVRSGLSSLRYIEGNYFRTSEAARKVADQIKEIFKNSKAE